ncbi:MAG TPA: hypothetical protein VHV08_02310 [Pirellulales bacterium]|nr:hypothetical protein [Pirellulales bacterium]
MMDRLAAHTSRNIVWHADKTGIAVAGELVSVDPVTQLLSRMPPVPAVPCGTLATLAGARFNIEGHRTGAPVR